MGMSGPERETPTAKEPPTNPPMGEGIWEEREENDRGKRAQDIRSQALGHAVQTIDPTGDPVPLPEVLTLADAFATYITDGTTP